MPSRPPGTTKRTPSRHAPRTSAERSRRRPLAVALTGGIGAGKSELLRALARHGAATISSDDIVHRLLREDDVVKDAMRERWGETVLGEDGEIDRARVGAIVFADREELAWLERLLHPRVVAEYLRWRDELARRAEPPAVCVTEVPLLYEVGADERFDVVVAVTASPEVRASRLIRPVVERERRLLPEEEKLRRADYTFVNDGPREDVDAFASDLLARLAR
ncbi:MAG: dephospho-CoA kinase [Thermoleophilia bacterium]|nr:dephospho-CoA kinase [Thermoleophilia bacterium]